ncbi:MAG: hypothetical protein Q7R30_23530 [Acidobacteriota bacterium]|nr:hypothetical protein [Acidobacteriota bacterium]
MTLRTACLIVLVLSSTASAQSAEPPTLRAHRATVSGGVTWSGSYPVGTRNAILRSSVVGASPPPFTLFSAASTVASIAGLEGRVGFAVTRNLVVEIGGAFAKPRVSTAISADPEVAAQVLEGEELQQYAFDAGAVWQLPFRFGRRARPFVSGGGGYLRQLHEGRTLVETGQIYYAGGGVRYWIRGGSGTRRSLGVRADARATWKKDGIDFDNRTRTFPTVSAFVFFEF